MLSLHAKKLVLIQKICIYNKHVIKDFKQIAGWINIINNIGGEGKESKELSGGR